MNTPKKMDRAKLFGFAQVEKVKSPGAEDRVIDRSSKIGLGEGTNKLLWSKIGDPEE
jgi:hypothetical protein